MTNMKALIRRFGPSRSEFNSPKAENILHFHATPFTDAPIQKNGRAAALRN
jgi:hypothetical protein